LRYISLPPSQLAQAYLPLQAYELRPSGGDFEIRLLVSPQVDPLQEIKSKQVDVGTKEKPKKELRYYFRVRYEIPISYQLLDGHRQLMREGTLVKSGSPETYNFGSERTEKALISAWNRSGIKNFEKRRQDHITSAVRRLGDRLSDQIDAGRFPYGAPLYLIRKGEKYGAEDLDEALATARRAIAAYNESGDGDALAAELAPALAIWRAGRERYDPNNRKEDDLFFAYAFNLAMGTYLAGDLDAAEELLAEADAAGKRSGQTRALGDRIADERERMAKNADISENYVGTYDPDFDPLFGRVGGDNDFLREDYLITISGERLEGPIRRGPPGILNNIPSFVVATERFGEIQDRVVQAEQVESVFAAGRLFSFRKLQSGSSLFTERVLVQIIENIDEGRVQLARQTEEPSGKPLSQPEYFLLGTALEKPVKLTGLRFLNVNNAADRTFGVDCETIRSKAERKAYGANEESYRRLARDLADCQ
jgi:hypothetical protein